ncbi:MAG TPA: A/G-specific adenine glycosylase [Pirellulales bacterium]|jgi:A/G-specific adenine glycosylase|nr:A/G-specific adenine glycosylase [Pirellulales bacterium]
MRLPSATNRAVQVTEQHPWPGGDWRSRFRRKLLVWYRRHARELAWRRDRDPYRVWVSEIMLQQTQVVTVEPYFERFIDAFPTIRALATAKEDSVLRLWEGLGYYRRARQLHRAAKIIAAEHGGQFPDDPDAVRRLPGVGRYTAGAILSIAFDRPEPILEANTVRLFSRLLACRGDTRRAAAQRLLWHAAETVLPARGVGRFNQALMELGSQVCRPREPDCPKCPVMELCPTHRDGLQASVPAVRSNPPTEQVREAAVVITRRGRVLLVRRGDHERWAGLWEFPRVPCDRAEDPITAAELIAKIHQRTGVVIQRPRSLTTFRHGVTRFRITLECFAATAAKAPRQRRAAAEQKWVRAVELADYPLSSTGRKLSRLVEQMSRSILNGSE